MSDYYYKPLTVFIDLCRPEKNHFGWFVKTEKTSMVDLYFLADDAQVRVREKTTGFFFETELEAFMASVGYYNRFGESYPYIVDVVILDAAEKKKSESKVMEFE